MITIQQLEHHFLELRTKPEYHWPEGTKISMVFADGSADEGTDVYYETDHTDAGLVLFENGSGIKSQIVMLSIWVLGQIIIHIRSAFNKGGPGE